MIINKNTHTMPLRAVGKAIYSIFRNLLWTKALAMTIILILNSCNNAPTEIGTEFLQDSISISSILISDSVITDVKSYYYSSPQERNTGALLVGINNDFKAFGMIRFNIPVGRTDIKVEDIVECNINFIFNNYYIGENKILSFKIREVISDWDIETNIDNVMNESLFENDYIAKWTGNIEDDSTISIPFPAELVVEWFEKIKEGIDIQDTIWGIAIVPDENTDLIASFKTLSGLNTGTFIDIKYKKDTTETIDSLKIYSAEEVSFIKSNKNIDTNTIILQGGARIHTKFTIDISNIDKLAAINNADITLFLDPDIECNPPDTLFLNYFGDNTERIYNSIFTIIGQYDANAKCYIFKKQLAHFLNHIIRYKNGIADVVLTYKSADRENNKIEKLNFLYDINDKHKYIKLKIFYSKI